MRPDDRDCGAGSTLHRGISTMATWLLPIVCLSSQNVHWQAKGAFTAEISAEMLLEHKVTIHDRGPQRTAEILPVKVTNRSTTGPAAPSPTV